MKIIFLDIDGVLNVYGKQQDKYGQIFHKHLVDNLKKIIDETNAKIVLSSSWRLAGLKTIQDMWKYRNLPGAVIDITPHRPNDDLTRGEEIELWLMKNNPIDAYVILDDDTDIHQLNHFVKTSDNIDHIDCVDIGYGLTSICADKAIEILKSKQNESIK